jgi:hypothetical protein
VVARADRGLQLALVEVPEAGAVFLTLGDATQLERGETVVVVDDSSGRGLSVRQAIVIETSRVLMGQGFVGLGGSGGTWSPGAAVIDGSGRVAAVVVGEGGDRVGLAVPAHVLYTDSPVWLPAPAGALGGSRWRDFAAAVDERDRTRVEDLASAPSSTALIRARRTGEGMIRAAVVRLADVAPHPERLQFRILGKRGAVCDRFAEVLWWRPAVERPEMTSTSRFLMWLDGHGRLPEAFVGECTVDLRGCAVAAEGARLELSGGVLESAWQPIHPGIR